MATARQNTAASEQPTSPADALASLRKLRNKVVHVSVSDPTDRKTFAVFELSRDSLVSVMDSYLQTHPEPVSREPNARLAAALKEAKHIKPRFTSAQELFDALEKEGQS